jgi:hypothetical protein
LQVCIQQGVISRRRGLQMLRELGKAC